MRSGHRRGIVFPQQGGLVAPEVVGPVLVGVHGLLGACLGLALVLSLRLASVFVAVGVAGAGGGLLVGIGGDFGGGDGNRHALGALAFVASGKDRQVGVLLHGEQAGVLGVNLVARADAAHSHQMIATRQMPVHGGVVTGHGGLDEFGAGVSPLPLGHAWRCAEAFLQGIHGGGGADQGQACGDEAEKAKSRLGGSMRHGCEWSAGESGDFPQRRSSIFWRGITGYFPKVCFFDAGTGVCG